MTRDTITNISTHQLPPTVENRLGTNETIYQALATEFWKPHGDSRRMAKAAAKAAGVAEADLPRLRAIIERHLAKPNFVAMAAELAGVLGESRPVEFSINGEAFEVGQVPDGKWVWSSANDEGKPCDSAAEAQADAMRHVREREAGEAAEDGACQNEVTQFFDRRDYA